MLKRKFGRKKANRDHMLRNLATSVILYEKVITTEAKAKEIKSIIDKSIVTAKKNNLAARRQLQSYFFDTNAVDKLVEVLGPRFSARQSGFSQVLPIGNRKGDGTAQSVITLLDRTESPAPIKGEKEPEHASSAT